ncbi:MAG: F0F1 ATP synthase subunit B [Sulfurimonas sp. RIFCSPHIGHO2_12_FULL_36_9]|uniref:F0F1 ATP synthase subunit B n=1 Tax=unclassified Sulfurimonas TaxID=2623549 RepID=UPI0008AC9B0C|nr:MULTISPECIES: F0F1 ATP synthase subunit B [unclassified Sulfurimonas]OHD97669.1 MAG: F0F1 ATP synthase subunit B [Sulfurimonas sp. RIFCSPHIGHO2_12_FULL_36_9]OHD98094.1 MAG: F0F1 ATP synthase subunit B [Sulfurimonas sp. RIFCSPLOWO2_02_FULL_36_28]OHE01618.1 MAG: F0F1 ATP synthase subunit B [Sulfurimonas sp. RIFCSPLOWO2_12_36_12]OHE03102.1 MAG: F0F1 ATP synthase subunit B [Sulfurimonas sp. RIFCSPLOWO2_12_FULL_36_74]
MSRILVFMLMISTYALASSGNAENASTDIVQRTVNFLLFAGLVWYLVAEPAKNYFASRSQSIADEMKKVQDKLKESVSLKKDALAKVSAAEKFAEDLVVNSKKENKIINDSIMVQCDTDIEILIKQQAVLIEFEQRKMVRSVVENTLKEVLSQSDDSFDKEAMANVILKKVA